MNLPRMRTLNEAIPYEYSITYNLNGGTNSANNPSNYNVLYGVTFSIPTKAGYRFTGWTDSNGNAPTTTTRYAFDVRTMAKNTSKITSIMTLRLLKTLTHSSLFLMRSKAIK